MSEGTRVSNGAQTRIERSRAKILSAAADVFLREGFLGASMDGIASAAGVSVQTIYSRFQSKEALFREVATALAGGAAKAVGREVETLPTDTTPEDWLLHFAIEQQRIVLTPRLMQLRRMVIGESGRFPEIGEALFHAGPGRAIDRLTDVLAQFADRGEMVIENPGLAAKQFNWLLMGGPTTEIMHLGDSAIPSKRRMQSHARETVSMFLAEYAVRNR